MQRNDGQMSKLAINLEGLTDDELMALNNDPSVHRDVKQMSSILRVARSCRMGGQIALALRHEARFDRMYEQLPKSLRW